MVYRQIDKRKTVKKRTNKRAPVLFLTLLAILVATLTVVCCLLFVPTSDLETVENFIPEPKISASDSSDETEIKIEKIDFQLVVDEWAAATSGNKSVLIYDLDREEVTASYNTDEVYNTASLYKLFVVYEGYRRLESGEWKADNPAGGTGYSILQCLDLAIRESYSPCAETLWSYIGHDELDTIIENDFNITDSDISYLTSNVTDIFKIMKIFYEHKDITSETLVAQIKDSFLNQPATTYNWRQGLPSGFVKANVYNKVGWDFNPNGNYWNIYHDAAIVEFPNENRHFIVVVMTNKVSYQQIKQLGTKIEEKFFSMY